MLHLHQQGDRAYRRQESMKKANQDAR